ncbi:hypothetical protein DP939_44615 [Spongiactinospora rosea]|uniref:prolyl oligopeptidase n=1 Tax=Spongiactinospora rosea TaxID=2248750 RepID=A0A366LEW9_9ACTN|nr:prolyl oligopeptidase family serine peptidase [Spongiactinospora rosea]RBQ11692.1 hypothetical protein DP939_44615 [Spongiactinospora rosea]
MSITDEPSGDFYHGVWIADPFRWLEDLRNPGVIAWSRQQNADFMTFASSNLDVNGFRQTLTELARPAVPSQPIWRGRRYFLTKEASDDRPAELWVGGRDRGEQPVLNTPGFSHLRGKKLTMYQLSLDGSIAALQLADDDTEVSALYILDLLRDRILDGPVGGTRYSPVIWLSKLKRFLYVRTPAGIEQDSGNAVSGRRVYLREPRTPLELDVEVLGAGLSHPSRYSLTVSRDECWIVATHSPGPAAATTVCIARVPDQVQDFHWISVQTPRNAITTVFIGPDGLGYALTDGLHDSCGLYRFDLTKHVGTDRWETIIIGTQHAELRETTFVHDRRRGQDRILATWLANGAHRVTVHALDGAQFDTIPLPGFGTVSGIGVDPLDSSTAWFTYTDPSRPPQVFEYDVSSGALTPHGTTHRERTSLSSKRADAPSRYGNDIPMLLTMGRPTTGTVASPSERRALMSIYGGFGVTSTPHYSPTAIAWIEQGGLYVNVDPRGSGGYGRAWREAGLRVGKAAAVHDIIDVAEWLTQNEMVEPGRISLYGTSNGGLLACAASIQRPDLFSSVTAVAPLTDMLRYDRSAAGMSWRNEYGSSASPADFTALRQYSPYHNVVADVTYPPTLLIAFQQDTRVPAFHAYKLGGKLQSYGARPEDIHVLTLRGGHGARPFDDSLSLLSQVMAFASWADARKTEAVPGDRSSTSEPSKWSSPRPVFNDLRRPSSRRPRR